MQRPVQTFSTWYEATASRGDGFAPLHGNLRADCCVIGGGYAGLTTALELARAGKSVVLLEAQTMCWSASGRNGGFVSNGFALGAGDLLAMQGRDRALGLYELSKLGTEYVRDTITRSGGADIKMGDGMRVCVRHSDKGGLHGHGAMLERLFGEDVILLSATDTQEILRTPRYHDSLFFPRAFHIHPLRYGLLLARLASEAGVAIHEHSPAHCIRRHGHSFRVAAAGGEVEVGDVVVTVSALDRSLHPETGRAVLPVATYVAVTAPLAQQHIMTDSAVADTRRAGDYYRLVDEGRLLWGGRITTKRKEPRNLAAKMRGDVLGTYPGLGKLVMDYAWSGTMAYALHKMPLIGRDNAGVWYGTGFGGHGVNTTAMAGLLLAGSIAHGDDRYKQFGAFAARWAGGPFGQIGVQGSYWFMQMRDWMDERLRA